MAPPRLAKLSPPRLGNITLRERLFAQLDQARQDGRMTWIGAPAGAGKTTLVASYLQQRDLNTLWYQVDAGDQDVAAFFYYLGLAAKHAGVRKALPLFTAEYQLGLPAFTRNWFRDLCSRLHAPAVIVLDNVQDAGPHAQLHTVLQHAADEIPEGIHLIAISRAQPPAELARLQANHTLYEIGWENLQFVEAEQQALVSLLAHGVQFSKEQLHQMHERTRGWVTGLILYLRRRALADTDAERNTLLPDAATERSHVFDYFATEVLAHTEPATREFLYAVALLPAMTSSMCQALTGDSNAKAILSQLERNHFFTTRRGVFNATYEFHPLFRDFLHAQAQQHFDAARHAQLRRDAGLLLAEAGDIEHAAPLLQQTQSWADLATLIKRQAETMEKQGRYQTLQEWLSVLPPEVVAHDPWLLFWSGMAQLSTDPFAAYAVFERAYWRFDELDNSVGMYRSWIGIATALFFRHDDMGPAHGWATQLDRLRTRHPRWPSLEVQGRVTTAALGMLMLGDPLNPALPDWVRRAERIFRFTPVGAVRCFVGSQLGMYYSFFGHIDKLCAMAERLKPLIASPKVPDIARLLANPIPIYAGWQTGNFTAANEAITVGMKLFEATGVYVTWPWFIGAASIVKFSQNELTQGAELMERFFTNPNHSHRLELSYGHFMVAWHFLLLDQFAAAKAQMETALALGVPCHSPFLSAQMQSGLVQTLIGLDESAAARTELDTLQRLSRECGNTMYQEFYCNILEAYLLDQSGGNAATARTALQRGFAAGAQNQWVTLPFWQPRLIARLCVIALQQGIEPDYAKKLIRIYSLVPPDASDLVKHWPYPIKIHTFGHFALRVDDAAQDLSGKGAAKPLELIKCLVALGGRGVAQEKIIAALWPDAEGDAGRVVFNTTLYRLRKLIKHEGALVLKDGLVSLDARCVWVDVWALERAVAQLTHELDHAKRPDVIEPLATTAFGFYTGPFLGHEKEHPWSLALRERLQGKMLRLSLALANTWHAQGQIEQAIATYERALTLDPLHEPTYQHLMRALLQKGRNAEVVATYERCRKNLSTLLGVMPSAQTVAIYSSVERVPST